MRPAALWRHEPRRLLSSAAAGKGGSSSGSSASAPAVSAMNNFAAEGRAAPPLRRMAMPEYVGAGPPGRHARSGHTVAVFGATGFLGRYVVNALGAMGTNLVVTTRRDDMTWRHLKVCADYGKLVPSYIHTKDEDSVRRTIAGCDAVVNLMGKYYETKHYLPSIVNCSFRDVNVDAAAMVARVAREEDCKHLVHVSCAYASPESSSENMRLKAEGELRVKEEFPGAVIVRPNVMYGEEDRFLNLYAMLVRMGKPFVPVVAGGSARLRPVYVADVGLAVAQAALNFTTAGQEYNLSGAHEYSHRQIFEYVMEHTGRAHHEMVDVPMPLAELIGRITDKLPMPYWTHDTMKLLADDCPGPRAGERTFEDLGMGPADVADFESRAARFLFRFKTGGHFADAKPVQTDVF